MLRLQNSSSFQLEKTSDTPKKTTHGRQEWLGRITKVRQKGRDVIASEIRGLGLGRGSGEDRKGSEEAGNKVDDDGGGGAAGAAHREGVCLQRNCLAPTHPPSQTHHSSLLTSAVNHGFVAIWKSCNSK